MFLIRESKPTDVDQLFAVAEYLDTVNLPADRAVLATLLERSSASFSGALEPAAREYLFVLEDADTGRVVGTSMIHAQHGTKRAPHVFLRVLTDERYSETLDRYMVHQCLQIGYNYDGPTEIGGLILHPDFRGHPAHLGKLLSYVRFLFMAMHRPVFRDRVISELLPPLEADGTSRLWKYFGEHFTGLSYQEADRLSKDNKEFIKSLFPHERIYVSLMPPWVQEVIGQVGEKTRGVEKMLRRIGFEYAQQIDPFDGGPHFIATTDDITLVKGARQARIEIGASMPADAPWSIVASDRPGAGFRATGAPALVEGETVRVTADVAEALGAGDSLWVVTP